jgi:ferredoxin
VGELTRREWLANLLPAIGDVAKHALPSAARPERRPPGAVGEPEFLLSCTRCGKCAEACPHAAIYVYDDGAGLSAGTPVMQPDRRACHFCEGFPCAAACTDGALSVPAAAETKLGAVRLAETRCFATAGPECGACAELCPGDEGALQLERGVPNIAAAVCNGCGLCIEACPVIPTAIELIPLSERGA